MFLPYNIKSTRKFNANLRVVSFLVIFVYFPYEKAKYIVSKTGGELWPNHYCWSMGELY